MCDHIIEYRLCEVKGCSSPRIEIDCSGELGWRDHGDLLGEAVPWLRLGNVFMVHPSGGDRPVVKKTNVYMEWAGEKGYHVECLHGQGSKEDEPCSNVCMVIASQHRDHVEKWNLTLGEACQEGTTM